ncbi:folate family ECF transporter S component [Vagococcus sp. DIV0080]|uniref:Folate family ECF transporter S component n=1 Tax=Candidatus Vagococcus giribetii TaxID=2230876 RepID=A0ABS3HR13_9ENTE|nr:folate family ECF transporter S component [Vagococcus sp. DIV0080]
MKRKISTKQLTMMSLLIALVVVLSNILSIETQFLKLTLEFIPKMMMGLLFGPFWTGMGLVVADVIGNTMFAKAPFFIGFTLNKVIEGLIYGYFFYGKKVTLKNICASTVCVTGLISLCMTPIWLAVMYQVPLTSSVIWLPRIIKAIVTMPIQIIIIYSFANVMPLNLLRKNHI